MLKKRIPTILGIFLLLVGITVGVYLVEVGPQPFTTKAGPEAVPNGVQVSNITDSSFVVSWNTQASTIGFVKYSSSPSNLNLSAQDVREQTGDENRTYPNHYVVVSDLNPETTYYFEIVSGTDSSTFADDGAPYSVDTGPVLDNTSVADTAYGTIYYPDLSPAEGALVYVSMENSSLLSSITSSSGSWAVPLSTIRTRDLSAFLDYDRENDRITVEVVASDGSRSSGIFTTTDDSPVEDIVIGETYDLQSVEQTPATQSAESQFMTEPFEQAPEASLSAVTVDNLSEGEAVNTQSPEFIGSGPPGKRIEIVVESEHQIEGSVVVAENGSWSWAIPSNLDPGEHSLTITWLDDNGITQTLTRKFTVFAQEESDLPAFEATPSATPTLTPTPTTAVGPTASPTPTPTLTPTPTVTPQPTASPSAATEPALPKPGTGFLSIFIVLSGLASLVLGSALLAYKRTS